MFADVRDDIKTDNDRNGMRPSSSGASMLRSSNPSSVQSPQLMETRPSSLQPQRSPRGVAPIDQYNQRYSYPAPSPHHSTNLNLVPVSHNQTIYADRTEVESGRRHNHKALATNEFDSSLSDRFAKLRTGVSSPSQDESAHSTDSRQQSQYRPSVDSHLNRDTPSLHMSTDPSHQSRPHIDTNAHNVLPKPPSPTYTPTKGTQDGVRFQPVKSVRSQQQYERPVSVASTVSSTRPTSRGSTYQSYTQDQEETSHATRPMRRRRRSINKPQETDVDVEKLYDYLQQFNVLLVDVRPRSEFDSGHILARSIICVEPTALRRHMSAEELLEALVLSPEEEQSLFERRNSFDLVVYYDQSSDISDWGPHRQKTPNPALQSLNDALLDFNQEKPLQWPPILLNGGLDAWVDLLGNQALQTSNTAQRPRSSKAISRRPVNGMSPQIDTQKRRHREYNPLDPEEERKWRERARSESLVLDQRPHIDENESLETTDESTVNMPDYEDFVNRFPDVADVEQQQQQQTSRGHPEQNGSRVPYYPQPGPPQAPPTQPSTRDASSPPSVPPTVPTKPAPAVPRRTYSGVSERVPQQTAPAKPPKLAPYIPPKLKRIPRTGLHNFGVTCYMNATIQCMSATIPLTAYFLDGQFQRDIQRDNWKGSKGLMADLYYTLLRNLWESHDVDTIRPSNFRKFCARMNREWGLDRQQDAKEYLEFLIDGLHEDLNINWRRNPLRPLTDDEEAQRERTPPFVASKMEWSRYEHRDHSRLTDYFAGQHISRLQCNVCKHSSTTYEPFYSISVEIPNIARRPVDIRDCLRSYCSAETLSGEEVWRCPNCKCEREATKRITITRMPENLVIHFKRFSASHSQSAKKITVPIEFPLKDLNMDPFVLPSPNGEQSSYISQKYGSNELQTPGSMRAPFRYDCFAVMRHLGGTIASGHYIALVKDAARGVWREFNDDRVRDFHPEDLSPSKRLQNDQAYILFYSRVRSAA